MGLQTANDHNSSIQTTTKSVHAETVRVVDEQMKDLEVQMTDLDDFVTRARSENAEHHSRHSTSMTKLSNTVGTSFSNISSHYQDTVSRVQTLGNEMEVDVEQLEEDLQPLGDNLCQPLGRLRQDIESTKLQDYVPTGETPERVQYQYPTQLPRTTSHEVLIASMHGGSLALTPSRPTATPSKRTPATHVFNDFDDSERARSPNRPSSSDSATRNPLNSSLRDLNANMTTSSLLFDPTASTLSLLPAAADENTMPIVKKQASRIPGKGPSKKMRLDGVENLPPNELRESASRRKSPRLQQ